ncbi:MAG: flagellar basal body protein [Caulobacteraceae bacterium]
MDSTDVISMTGLKAAQTQLQVSASNLANMDDSAPLPTSGVKGPAPYAPTRVQTVSLGSGGVQAQLSAASPAGRRPMSRAAPTPTNRAWSPSLTWIRCARWWARCRPCGNTAPPPP